MWLENLVWKLGLTKARRLEFSGVLYEAASVTARDTIEEEDSFSGVAGIVPASLPMTNRVYRISFRGEKTSFNLRDKRLFEEFKIGDEVKVGYKERYNVILNYIPPNFDQRGEIGRTFLGHRFVSAEKL